MLNHTFTLYIGNGFVDKSKNKAQNERDVRILAHFLRGYCYRQFHGGQMEQVLDDMVIVAYIKTPAEVISIRKILRKMGIKGRIDVELE